MLRTPLSRARSQLAGSWLALPVGLALTGVLLAPAAPLLAQASPVAASPVPVSACTGDPLSAAELTSLLDGHAAEALAAMMGTPVALPLAPGMGEPADAATAAAVADTMEGIVACTNAGDRARLFSYYSENFLIMIWGGMLGEERTAEQVADGVASLQTPEPVAAADQAALLSVAAVELQPDGRVAASIELTGVSLRGLFVAEDGQWKLDGVYPVAVDGATPTP